MTNEAAKKRAKIYGWVFLILGIIELIFDVILAVSVATPSIRSELLKTVNETVPTTEGVFNAVMIITIAYSAISALIAILLGRRAIAEAKGENTKHGYVTLAKILMVLELVGLAFGAAAALKVPTEESVSNLLGDLVWAYIVCDYVTAVTTLTADKKKK